jgi:hypothetical protein
MAHPLVWLLAGLAAPKLYEKLSSESKKEWKKKYPVHHGEAGVLMLIGGTIARNPGLAAFGVGLVIEDWKDRNEWFKKNKNDLNDEEI